ncbi:MAG: aminotransferase class I/II-fold pyridoxal phosphate-dependent enzyme [Rickettsiales bacterium]|nr:aminotransferase class I/II-fold pyridoxal phosphate-dependent enzyme [Rickettsiales bacterium]
MLNFYIQKLKDKIDSHTYRQTINTDCISDVIVKRHNKKLISFSCNDYFGLSHHKKVKKAAIKAIKKYGVGARASRFVTGNNSLYEKLEKKIAKLKHSKDALVFSTGYQAAIGVIPALVGRNDLIVADKLMHSCFLDAANLSGAKLLRFEHNDMDHAKQIITQHRSMFEKCIIVTETVFSMDGDCGNIKKLLQLAVQHDAYLISDAAHDLFIDKPVIHPNHIQMGTLSKGFGALGGYVAGDKDIIDYLRNYTKSLIYSTALPASILAAAIVSCDLIRKKHCGKRTLENVQYFLHKLEEYPAIRNKIPISHPTSAIVPVIIGSDKEVTQIAQEVEKQGLLISAIRYPTVPKNSARLRITFSSEHSKKEIDKLINILSAI